MTRRNVAEDLESLIDATSLLDVLVGLECVCAEKAAFIECDWQDRQTAAPWRKASRIVESAARKASELGL